MKKNKNYEVNNTFLPFIALGIDYYVMFLVILISGILIKANKYILVSIFLLLCLIYFILKNALFPSLGMLVCKLKYKSPKDLILQMNFLKLMVYLINFSFLRFPIYVLFVLGTIPAIDLLFCFVKKQDIISYLLKLNIQKI